ncbi:hypothetical protein [Enterococcus faecalis]|uniref:DNA double-strand break repair Rad50 ATPase n=1 Tax=Enterococcus faecalis RP2S-4 TaxID=1244145 RepID=A0ABC9TJY3_ENTFL|nr:hypothetical protein [Enterococcus faecalis]EPI09173.1 hypothetical protein D358_01264 [Enterococcus faecalis RP2S-4]
MEKENNDKIRIEYNHKIAETEQRMDMLSSTRRQMRELYDNLEGELTRDSRKLQNLTNELIQGGNREARWFQEELIDRQRKFNQAFQQASQEFWQQCTRRNEELNEEHLQFQKERNELPWD